MTIQEAIEYLDSLGSGWRASVNPFDPYTFDPMRDIREHIVENVTASNVLMDRLTAPPPDKATRLRQINTELDIIRGRVPTPPGYKIDPRRIKQLMAELKQLI